MLELKVGATVNLAELWDLFTLLPPSAKAGILFTTAVGLFALSVRR